MTQALTSPHVVQRCGRHWQSPDSNVIVNLQLTQSNSKSLLQNPLRNVELVDLIKLTELSNTT